MTTKDYKMIAESIRYVALVEGFYTESLAKLINELCIQFAKQNPRFDENKFRAALKYTS